MYIEIAGVLIDVRFKYTKRLLPYKEYIKDYDDREPDLIIDFTYEDINSKYLNTVRGTEITNKSDFTLFFELDRYEFFVMYHKIAELMPQFDVFMIHGAAVATDNYSYIFMAPSGTGKTTRAKLWVDEYPGSFIINGDKPLIKLTENEVLVCGSPWCGKEGWNTNVMIPLRAIFMIERADDDEETIVKKLKFIDVFPLLLEQTYLSNNNETMRKTLHFLKVLEEKVGIYKFRGKPTVESIRLAYKTVNP